MYICMYEGMYVCKYANKLFLHDHLKQLGNAQHLVPTQRLPAGIRLQRYIYTYTHIMQ